MSNNSGEVIAVSLELDRAGLVWHPEIGDEVAERATLSKVAVLVDPQGYTPTELRSYFLWLPTVEQMVLQLEAREAFIYHVGITKGFSYEALVKTSTGMVETSAGTLRLAFGRVLQEVLSSSVAKSTLH